jgi:hypothetical protein
MNWGDWAGYNRGYRLPFMTTSPCAAVPLMDFLDDIVDSRVERARLHSRHDILVTTILAVVCGADSGTDVELFGHSKHAWLSTLPGAAARHPLARHLRSGLGPAGSGGVGTRFPSLGAVVGQAAARRSGRHRRQDRPLLPRPLAGGARAARGQRLGGGGAAGSGPAKDRCPVQRDSRHPPNYWNCWNCRAAS